MDKITIITQKKPDAKQMEDMLFAWKVAKHVRSNAIVIANNSQAISIGAGQMSRFDEARLPLLNSSRRAGYFLIISRN